MPRPASEADIPLNTIETLRMCGEEVFLVARQRPVRTVIQGELKAPIRARMRSDSRFLG
jgi:hypothetical protein